MHCLHSQCQWRAEGGEVGVFNPPSRKKFRRPSKIVPNSTRLWKLIKIAEFRTPTLQDVRKKGSKILKLPPVRNCFTSTMPNKLVVIINSLKLPKIKKLLLYEMKFLVPNYSWLRNPWLGGRGLPPPDPLSLSSTKFFEPPHPNKFPGYATGQCQFHAPPILFSLILCSFCLHVTSCTTNNNPHTYSL
jgi:hypothetical protein